MMVSFGFPFGRPFKHSLGGRDRRFRGLDDGVAAAFSQDVPGVAEVDLVWVFGGNADGAAVVDLGLPLAVVLGDLADLQREFGLVVAEGEAENFQGPFLPFGGRERFRLGFAGPPVSPAQGHLRSVADGGAQSSKRVRGQPLRGFKSHLHRH
jgi:hypothetical protein